MAGEFSGSSPESDGGDECMSLLKNLGREEILEILFGGEGICKDCRSLLKARIHNHINEKLDELSVSNGDSESSAKFLSANSSGSFSSEQSQTSTKSSTSWSSPQTPDSVYSRTRRGFVNSSPASVDRKQLPVHRPAFEISLNDGLGGVPSVADNGVLEEQKERIRFGQIRRKKDFVHIERIDGKAANVLKGIELHTQVFNTEEQKKIVGCVYALQRKGQQGQLRARTYSEPRKWMRGKGRVTIQFGCCYNYAVDKNGNPPGIVRDEDVDPLPPLFVAMIKRMVRWHVLPPTCIPNSCIVNLYDEGDCIPPHIDHHDFLRPFCTVSFLTECNILFGANLKIVGPGEFAGPVSIPLPVGSVFILNGNGADVAKHCVPGVPGKRISITFRKMDESKLPYNYSPVPELMGIKPLTYSSSPAAKLSVQQNQQGNDKISPRESTGISSKAGNNSEAGNGNNSLLSEADAFPPLGSSNPGNRQRRANRNGPW